jgi:hypothetical protein
MLLQNATNFSSNPITLTGGTLAGESVYLGLRDQTFLAFAGSVPRKSAIPQGYGPGDAWYPAIQAGGLGAASESSLVGSANLSGGVNLQATAAIALDGTAEGSLIASMTAASSSALSASADIFSIQVASIQATASIALSSSAVVSAIASVVASGSATLTGAASQGANAFMVAAAGGPEALSPQGLANAVWSAFDSDNNTPGTMGAKLNAAASAGDPWSTLLPGSYAPGTAGYLMTQLAIENPDIALQLEEVWQRMSLDPANPLVNTASSITTGAIEIAVTKTTGQTTFTRT